MNTIFPVLLIAAIIFVGASLLALMGFMMSLGYYDRQETQIQLAEQQEEPVKCPEST